MPRTHNLEQQGVEGSEFPTSLPEVDRASLWWRLLVGPTMVGASVIVLVALFGFFLPWVFYHEVTLIYVAVFLVYWGIILFGSAVGISMAVFIFTKRRQTFHKALGIVLTVVILMTLGLFTFVLLASRFGRLG